MIDKIYDGSPFGMKYAFKIKYVDMDKPHALALAIEMMGMDKFLEYSLRMAHDEFECTTCCKPFVMIGDHPQRGRTLVYFAHPTQPMSFCSCHECTERYGGAHEAAKMCSEYLVELCSDPDARMVEKDERELKVIDA